jgi:hypothetical protein
MNLTATVTDKASGPIRDLQRTLEGASKTGTQDTDKLTRAAEMFGDVVHNVGVGTARAFGLVGSSIAAASVTGVGALAALGVALRGVARDSEDLRHLSDTSHVTVEGIQELERVGKGLGLTTAEVSGGVSKLAGNFWEMSEGTARAVELQRQFQSSGIGQFYDKLANLTHGKNLNEATAAFFKMMRGMDPRQAQKFAEIMTGVGKLGVLGKEGPGWLANAPAAIEINTEAMRKFARETSYTEDRLDSLKNQIFNESAPAFIKLTEDLNKFIDANKGEIGAGIVKFFGGVKDVITTTEEEFQRIKPELEAVNALLEKLGLGVPKEKAAPGTPEREKQDREEEKGGGMLGITGPIHRTYSGAVLSRRGPTRWSRNRRTSSPLLRVRRCARSRPGGDYLISTGASARLSMPRRCGWRGLPASRGHQSQPQRSLQRPRSCDGSSIISYRPR